MKLDTKARVLGSVGVITAYFIILHVNVISGVALNVTRFWKRLTIIPSSSAMNASGKKSTVVTLFVSCMEWVAWYGLIVAGIRRCGPHHRPLRQLAHVRQCSDGSAVRMDATAQ